MDFFLKKLKENGNTIVLVEHNPRIIRYADHVIELGPRAGSDGGRIIFSGSREAFFAGRRRPSPRSISSAGRRPLPAKKNTADFMDFKNAGTHNLKHFDFQHPPPGIDGHRRGQRRRQKHPFV